VFQAAAGCSCLTFQLLKMSPWAGSVQGFPEAALRGCACDTVFVFWKVGGLAVGAVQCYAPKRRRRSAEEIQISWSGHHCRTRTHDHAHARARAHSHAHAHSLSHTHTHIPSSVPSIPLSRTMFIEQFHYPRHHHQNHPRHKSRCHDQVVRCIIKHVAPFASTDSLRVSCGEDLSMTS
jgi:hypothetical protein